MFQLLMLFPLLHDRKTLRYMLLFSIITAGKLHGATEPEILEFVRTGHFADALAAIETISSLPVRKKLFTAIVKDHWHELPDADRITAKLLYKDLLLPSHQKDITQTIKDRVAEEPARIDHAKKQLQTIERDVRTLETALDTALFQPVAVASASTTPEPDASAGVGSTIGSVIVHESPAQTIGSVIVHEGADGAEDNEAAAVGAQAVIDSLTRDGKLEDVLGALWATGVIQRLEYLKNPHGFTKNIPTLQNALAAIATANTVLQTTTSSFVAQQALQPLQRTQNELNALLIQARTIAGKSAKDCMVVLFNKIRGQELEMTGEQAARLFLFATDQDRISYSPVLTRSEAKVMAPTERTQLRADLGGSRKPPHEAIALFAKNPTRRFTLELKPR